jgi:hypothetical protein
MLYMSQAEASRSSRRWAWANRPLQSLENPVKRYLRDRSVGSGLNRSRRWVMGRMILRPAV